MTDIKDDPKKRLLDAAIGFMHEGNTPTTRDLADRAGVNLAAISYYFQGKDNLMAEALDQAAHADLTKWIADELDADAPASQRLRKLALFLGRIHRNFHTIAHLQLQFLALDGRPERATELACQTMVSLIAEHRGLEPPDHSTRVAAASLMASFHYLSIFHEQFETMTGIAVDSDESRDRYVLELLNSHDLDPEGLP